MSAQFSVCKKILSYLFQYVLTNVLTDPLKTSFGNADQCAGNQVPIRYLLVMHRIESEFLEQPLSQVLPGISEGEIIVIRSTRRKRNIAAYRQGGQIVVSIPARLSKADERMVVPEMVAKVRAQEATRVITDSALSGRVVSLLAQWAPEMSERPFSVTWRENMNGRWGSCTSVDGTIRISARLARFPEYVLDYVLFHEGIHLRYGDHGAQFQELLARFPRGDLAQAYLDGYEAAENALTPASLSR